MIKRIFAGLMSMAVLFGVTACSPNENKVAKKEKMEEKEETKVDAAEVYETLVNALVKNDKRSIDPITKGGMNTLQTLRNVAETTQLKEVEVEDMKKLETFDQFALYAFRLEADYESVSDVPMLQFAIMEKTDNGYLYYSQDDINTRASLYDDFKAFVDKANEAQANYVDESFNKELADFKASHQAEYDALLASQQSVVAGDMLQI